MRRLLLHGDSSFLPNAHIIFPKEEKPILTRFERLLLFYFLKMPREELHVLRLLSHCLYISILSFFY